MRTLSRKFIAGLVFAFCSLGIALADNSKISPDLLPLLANPNANLDVIIQYNSLPQTCTGGGLLGGLVCTISQIPLVGGVLHVVLDLINGVEATLQPADIINTSNQSNVVYISPNRLVAGSLDYSTAAVNAPTAWNTGLDGTGVGVAVIDSGIYPHPDLNVAGSTRSRIVYRQSFAPGVQFDDFGHGTHVAGIIAGNGSSSKLPGSEHILKGVAPNANLLDLRVLDANGTSNDMAVISAIATAIKLKNTYNVVSVR